MAATMHASTPAGAETAFHPQLFRGSAVNKGAGAPPPPPPSAVTCSLSTSSTTSAAVTRTASPSVSPSPSSTSHYSHLPIHGLQIDASQYPLHPSFSSSSSTTSTPQVRLITADQYAELVYNHSNIKLNEERILFPWLHGADIPNSAQAENFGFRNGAYKAVPRYRGLFTIAAHGPRADSPEEEQQIEEEDETAPTEAGYASHHEKTSSCDSIFVDPSCHKTESPSPMLMDDDESAQVPASVEGLYSHPHYRQPTSASLATSYSSDSFCSSSHTPTSSSSSSSSSSAIFSHSSSGLASSASSIYSYESGPAVNAAVNKLSRKDTRGSLVGSIDEETACDMDGMDGAMTPPSSVSSSACLARQGEEENSNSQAIQGMMQEDEKTKIMQKKMTNARQHQYGPEEYASLLVNSHHPHDILAYEASYEFEAFQRRRRERQESSSTTSTFSSTYSPHGSSTRQEDFHNEKEGEEEEDDDSKFVCFQSLSIPTNTVSFRNYRLQKYKYATISDIVIYHAKGGLHRDAIDIARKVSIAIEKMKLVRVERGEEWAVDYNVFVVLEPFHVFEENHPHLVKVDSQAWPTENKFSFTDVEIVESNKLTKASKIGENVFLGNTFDVPLSTVAEHDLHSQTREMNVNASSLQRQSSPCLSSTSSSFSSASSHSLLDGIPHLPFESLQNVNLNKQTVGNKDKYSICIEARDGAAMCSTRNLRERERYLDDLQIQIQHEREQQVEETRRREGLKSAPIAGIIPSFGRNNKIVKKGKKRSTSAFWFSSSSSSSSDDEDGRADEADNLESSSDSSDYEDLRRRRHGRQEEEDHSDFEDFADEKELLYDAPAPSGSAFACASNMDADLTLSPTRFGMSLMDENVTPVGSPSSSPSSRASSVAARASLAQASGRCISPPPFGYSVGNDKTGRRNSSASSHSTPIKLQYKKSKSLNKARELEMAQAKIKAAAAEADARLALKARQASISSIDPSKPRGLLEIAPEEIVYMECLSTAQTLNQHTLPAMADAMVEYVVWLRSQARPHLRTSRELQRACAVHHQRQEESFPHQRQPFGFSSPSATMRNRMSADADFQPMARKVLIHCSDGYTDSSILALSYIMYDQAISLPQAYLYLQNDCNRSFFVYNSDVAFLQAVEKRLSLIIKSQGRERFNDDISDVEREAILAAERRAKEREEERAATVAAATAEAERNNQSTSMMAGMGRGVGAATRDMAKNLIPRPGLFSRSSSKDSTASSSTIKAGARVSFNAHSSNTAASSATLPRGPPPPYKASSSQSVTMSVPPPLAARIPKEDANAISHAWFHSEHFDGHFPSRILDYLYLGNLSHASNALMLKELGITHVLSIGESALVPPERQCAPSSGSSAARARTPTNSLWVEHHLGNITVMDVQGINDDGVDTILPHLMAGMRFIDLARQTGGKCLVHCRVGVSRSATIVIGQVMKDLDMSLAEAYLLVRARRLNILIQPTILFMHTLWTWEEEIRNLNPDRAIKDEEEKKFSNNPKRPAFEKSGRICWPVLCTEIADINNKYLNC